MRFTKTHSLIIFAFLSICYALLRFWKLTDSCLWFDEIFSVHAAEHDWNSLFRFVAQDLIHPPLFYILLKIWISAGGESLFWLRLFPVVFSLLALIPFYFLCRELKLNNSTIAIALAFLAANGALIKYSQEVRMYSLLLCLSLFSIWLFTRFYYSGKNLLTLVIINILLIYTHYYGWFVVLSEVATILALHKIKTKQILLMFGIVLISFVPWILAVYQAANINSDVAQNIGWVSKPNLQGFFQFIFDALEPFYYQQSSNEPTSIFFITIPLVILIGAAKILYLNNWENEDEKSQFYLLCIFTALPILLAFVISWLLPVSIWGTRHLIIVFAPILILSAKFLTEIKIQTLKTAISSVVFLLYIAALALQVKAGQPKFIWCGWENLAQNVDSIKPEKIYVYEDLTAYHFWFALRESKTAQVIKVNNVKGLEEDKAYFIPRGFDGIKTIDENDIGGERFWIAFRDSDWSEAKPPLKNLIEKGYTIGTPKIYEAQGIKAFLVEAKK